jgi:hypothetical protein
VVATRVFGLFGLLGLVFSVFENFGHLEILPTLASVDNLTRKYRRKPYQKKRPGNKPLKTVLMGSGPSGNPLLHFHLAGNILTTLRHCLPINRWLKQRRRTQACTVRRMELSQNFLPSHGRWVGVDRHDNNAKNSHPWQKTFFRGVIFWCCFGGVSVVVSKNRSS